MCKRCSTRPVPDKVTYMKEEAILNVTTTTGTNWHRNLLIQTILQNHDKKKKS
jgi:hypothetical protein